VAVYKCGAIAVPLFALFGPDALQYRLADSGVRAFWPALNSTSEAFDAAPTSADDPAVIIYTPGTTGKPKGALHAHRVLPGHLPGVEMSQGFFPDGATAMWTPADWAWIGGLYDVLLPSLHHGCRRARATLGKIRCAGGIRLHAVARMSRMRSCRRPR
jgi:acetyl-CoA synthetase